MESHGTKPKPHHTFLSHFTRFHFYYCFAKLWEFFQKKRLAAYLKTVSRLAAVV